MKLLIATALLYVCSLFRKVVILQVCSFQKQVLLCQNVKCVLCVIFLKFYLLLQIFKEIYLHVKSLWRDSKEN